MSPRLWRLRDTVRSQWFDIMICATASEEAKHMGPRVGRKTKLNVFWLAAVVIVVGCSSAKDGRAEGGVSASAAAFVSLPPCLRERRLYHNTSQLLASDNTSPTTKSSDFKVDRNTFCKTLRSTMLTNAQGQRISLGDSMGPSSSLSVIVFLRHLA